ncbi:lytic transglycosylase domain-containing protein [uncultured Paludibaculum sp.]|uniref:lytic transglycosylase domain-containing protein n=1 Tax=uncultured Paludibaculum sp. TaxID=1765020 RepID=UPI002AAC2E88|nr:lytic transglycosylase domain-containing protein [uncultured Paludibaculum sp.]
MTRFALFLAVATLPLAAADIAVLHTGARIRAQHIEKVDDRYILTTADSRIELKADLIAELEHEEGPPPPQAAMAGEPAPLPPTKPADPKKLVTEAALRYGLPPAIVHALAMTESAYQPNAISRAGAIGVMQLMPGTAQSLNADPNDVEQNIDAGTRLLRELLVKYENDPNPVRRALAAYNAGSGAVAKYNGVPPYRETQTYVEKVIERYWKQVNAQPTGSLAVPDSAAQTPAQ